MIVLSIIEIILLIGVFIWIYILYQNKKEKSMRKARIVLISMTILIVITQFYIHKTILNKKEIIPASQVDTVAPIIVLNGEKEVKFRQNTRYIEPGYTATDDQDGNITDKVQVEREKVADGKYDLLYSVTDSAGNKSEVQTRTVIVEKNLEKDKSSSSTANKAGVIYLTFDDGPSLDITPQVLDILKEEDIKATFFTYS